MPVPGLIAAAAIAARVASAARTTRIVGGIVGQGGKSVNPVYNTPVIPSGPKVPGLKSAPVNPPNPPTGSSIPKKPTHVSEKRDGAIENKNPKLSEKPKPKKNPTKNRGPFSGDMARYNWTGN